MGQILSYISNIWRCIRPELEGDDQFSDLGQQSYYITIPDGDTDTPWRAPETFVNSENQTFATLPAVPARRPSIIVVSLRNVDEAESEEKQARPVTAIKRIGLYTSAQTILLVGEGDFSFSASLAVAFGSASNIIATSLNSKEYLIRNYRKFFTNKMKLETRGCMVIHGVDATNIVQHSLLGNLRFDRIIYNFPHTGNFGRTDFDLRENKDLVIGFLANAKKMLNENGEIHVTHKSNGYFRKWNISKIGRGQGLHLIQEIRFDLSVYPGYHTKFGFKGDRDFDCNPSKTYRFGTRRSK